MNYNLKNKNNFILTEDQVDIVEALVNNDVFFNCAQTGFGKTYTTITAAVHKYKEFLDKGEDIHFVLLIPSSAEKIFVNTFKNLNNVPYNIFTASKKLFKENAKFSIFNYTTLTNGLVDKKSRNIRNKNGYVEKLIALKKRHKNLWLIADEVHALQDTNSQQYIVMKVLMSLFTGKWGLTATPILNDLEGLYNMVDLFKPGFFTNVFAFRAKFMNFETREFWKKDIYGVAKKTEVKELIGFKNLGILKALFSKISIVKSKEYNINFNYIETNISEDFAKYYKYAANGLFSGTKYLSGKNKGKTKKGKQSVASARLHDLQRVVSNSHPDFKYLKNASDITEKELLLINTIKDVINKNEATLVYFSYLETLDRVKYILEKLQAKLGIGKIHLITGAIPTAKRRIVEDTLKPGDVVLLTSAGTESINLQKANNLIFYEIPFPLREFIQACGRITRTDSKYDIFNIYILEAIGTIDTYKKMRIVANAEPINVVLSGSNALSVELLELSYQDREDMKKEYLWWHK